MRQRHCEVKGADVCRLSEDNRKLVTSHHERALFHVPVLNFTTACDCVAFMGFTGQIYCLSSLSFFLDWNHI